MAMALRPFASSASMNSRYGSQALSDGVEARLGLVRRAIFVSRVGGHLYGRFWMAASPASRRSDGNASRLQIGRGSFAPNVYGSFNPPQGPAKSAQRKDLLFLFFAQDIHRRRINPRYSQCPGSAIPLAAFQVSTDGRF
jgi:hypothetical protein